MIFKKVTLLALLAVSLVSCAFEVDNTPVKPVEQVEVGFEISVNATRTSLDPDGRTTRWSEGDKLAVWAMDADGGYAFENATFMLRYFSSEYDKAFFTSNIAQMDEGDYTYYLSYPTPVSTNGTLATYTLPAVQTGEYDGRYDVMVAEPVVEGALTASKRVELNTIMRHQMHGIKITVPEGRNLHGSRLYRLEITFPNDVVGDIVVDVSNPEATPTYVNTSNKIILESEEGFDAGDTLWAFVLPGTIDGDVSYFARSERRRSNVATYPLTRTFEAGHVTPINMVIPEVYPYYTAITVSVGSNNLGEDFNYFDVYDNNGNHVGRYERNASNKYTIFDYEGEYDANVLDNTSWRVVFDSDHAIVESTISVGDVTSYTDNVRSVDVPYLLYQDFSTLSDYTDEATTGSKTLSISGWTASRTNCKDGVIQLATFYGLVGRFQGRLDSEPINVIKDKANISVTFYANNNINKKVAVPLQMGWGADSGAIEAGTNITNLIATETLAKGSAKTITYQIDNFARGGRLAWRTNVTSGYWTTYNYLGIDNIKVQIAK